MTYEVGCIVEPLYNWKLYRGQITEYGVEHQEYEVKFLKQNQSGNYVWGKTTWTCCLPISKIVKVIESEPKDLKWEQK